MMIDTRTPTEAALAAAALTALTAVAAATAPAAALAATAERCGRAVVASSNKIVRTDSRALSRCALATLQQAPAGEVEEICSKLRSPGLRLDRLDARARERIERRCAAGAPEWLPMLCPGPGPRAGEAQADAISIARCATTSAHCSALATLDMVFDDAVGALDAQHPGNLRHAFGGNEGTSFAACADATGSTTTTTMPDTTTTTMPIGPTTTLAGPTTTSTTSTTSTTTTLAPGGSPALVITEIMANPAAQSDAAGEYFEILNIAGSAVDLDGLEIADQGSDSFTVVGTLVVGAGQRVVFGKTETAADGFVDYVYGSGMNLTNSSDEIVILAGADVIDVVAYDAEFPAVAGRSIELIGASNAVANDAASAWCASDSPLGDGDFGTPGTSPGACMP